MPIDTVIWPGIESTFEKIGLLAVSITTYSFFAMLYQDFDLLSIYAAKPSIYWVTAAGRSILIKLQCAISIFDVDFFFFNGQIRGSNRAGRFSTILAMAEMTAWFCE